MMLHIIGYFRTVPPQERRTADGMGCAGLEHAGLGWAGLHGLAVAKLVAKPVIGMR